MLNAPAAALWQNGWIDAMARGHKTGGRQKGTPNKRKADYDAKLAEAAGQMTAALALSEIASLMPPDVLLLEISWARRMGAFRMGLGAIVWIS